MSTLYQADPCAPSVHIPIAKTKRELHLETLLTMALPYIERDELSTRTSPFTRHLIAEIKDQLG